MAKPKNDQTIRSMLLNNGALSREDEVARIAAQKNADKQASQAAAIAARRASFATKKP
jgi:hypothetical protein